MGSIFRFLFQFLVEAVLFSIPCILAGNYLHFWHVELTPLNVLCVTVLRLFLIGWARSPLSTSSRHATK